MSYGISGIGGGYPPQITSGASSRSAKPNSFAQLFKQMDTSNDGSVSKSEFEAAFNKLPQNLKDTGVDAAYSKLDPNNTGSVSKQDFVHAMRNIMAQYHQGNSQSGDQGATSAASTVATNLQELNSTFSAYL